MSGGTRMLRKRTKEVDYSTSTTKNKCNPVGNNSGSSNSLPGKVTRNISKKKAVNEKGKMSKKERPIKESVNEKVTRNENSTRDCEISEVPSKRKREATKPKQTKSGKQKNNLKKDQTKKNYSNKVDKNDNFTNNIDADHIPAGDSSKKSQNQGNVATKPKQKKLIKGKQKSNVKRAHTKLAAQNEITKTDNNENITNNKSTKDFEFIHVRDLSARSQNVEESSHTQNSPQSGLWQSYIKNEQVPSSSSRRSNEESQNILNENDNYEDLYGLVIEDDEDAEEEEEGLTGKQSSKRKPFPTSFPCNFCEMVFISPIDLLRHKRMSHKYPRILVPSHQIKMYYDVPDKSKCPICTKPIKTQDNFPSQNKWALIRHLKTHTDERNYECPKCKRKFKRLDHMKDHAKRHF